MRVGLGGIHLVAHHVEVLHPFAKEAYWDRALEKAAPDIDRGARAVIFVRDTASVDTSKSPTPQLQRCSVSKGIGEGGA